MNKILLTSTAIMSVFIASPAFASDDMAQLKAQMKSMQRQMDKLKAQIEKSEKKSAMIASASNSNSSSDTKITFMPAPKFESADGEYSFKVGGILQVDAGFSGDDKADHPDGTNLRRARMNVSGVFMKDFSYKLEADFAGDVSRVTDAFIQYNGFKPFSLRVGNFKEPFGMEATSSDIYKTFIESAGSTTTFSTPSFRRIGAMLTATGKNDSFGAWSARVGAFGGAVNTVDSIDDETVDFAGRLTWAPIAEKTKVLHMGVSGLHRISDPNTHSITLGTRSENNLSTDVSERAIDTGAISNVDSINGFGAELAGVYGPASFQGEYVLTKVNRSSGVDPTFSGYYVEGSYYLTGESRNYLTSRATFGRVKPLNPLTSKGGYGAWSVQARYSNTDLNDFGAGITGGRMKNTTLGITWLPNNYTMITANYVMVNTDSNSVVADDDPDLLLLRAQVVF